MSGSDGDNVGTVPELVSKEAFRHSEQVHGTVRREEVDLIEEGTATNQYAGGVTSPRRS